MLAAGRARKVVLVATARQVSDTRVTRFGSVTTAETGCLTPCPVPSRNFSVAMQARPAPTTITPHSTRPS